MTFLNLLIVLALVAVAISLLLGLTSLRHGGRFDRAFGTRFMWARVILQASAVILLALAWWVNG